MATGARAYDVVVVGGGPAGMMAAGTAAARGRSVLLLEKNPGLGKKLLITGGGRCNVTNNTPDTRKLLGKYKGSDKFLFSAFSQFGVEETLAFFRERGMEMKEENDGRMFPVSNSARSVLEVLQQYLKAGKVEVRTHAEVTGIRKGKEGIDIVLRGGESIAAPSCIVATGGISRPDTGSTGEGFTWLRNLGHTVIDTDVALVPIALRDQWVKKLGGVTLPNVKLTVFCDEEKEKVERGKLLFTHFGISGPTVLGMSRAVGEYLESGEVTIVLDLFPDMDHRELKQQFTEILAKESNRKFRNALAELVPAALATPLIELVGADPETPTHSVRSEDRTRVATLLKDVPLHVSGLLGKGKAVVSSGGADLGEVDFKTMESKIIPGLYLIGDTLNIDRPSGGYSLQLAWTTGYVAGTHA